jgi:hypothetical protein
MIDNTRCLVCQKADDDLNTVSFKLDDEKVKVSICDDHEDLRTKDIKEIYSEKMSEINAILEQAKKFGLELSTNDNTKSSGKLVTMKRQAIEKNQEPALDSDEKLVSEAEAQRLLASKAQISYDQSAGGVGGAAAPHQINSIRDGEVRANPGQKKVALDIVEGRGGQPVRLEKKVVDNYGVTDIIVNKPIDDHQMQQRFKNMSSNTMREDGGAVLPNFASNGYEAVNCNFCNGSGQVVVKGKKKDICPRCNGQGIVSRN